MKEGGIAIQERSLNEFLYTVIMTLTKEQKDSLPKRIRLKINTVQRAKKFIEKSSTDQKRELLMHLEISSFFVVLPMGITAAKQFVEVIKMFTHEDVAVGVREAAKAGVFVIEDSEFEFGLRRMAQTMTKPPYVQHLELKRAGNAIVKWSTKLNLPESELDATEEDVNAVIKFLIGIGFYWPRLEELMKLDKEQMLVLLFFFMHRNKYIERSKVDLYFSTVIPKSRRSWITTVLTKKLYLQSYDDGKTTKFTISKLGIRAVSDFRDKLLSTINF